ncbi:hypothetical protein ASF55_17785 [Methylobacterium sp. Leaf119]|nr:hypothetical protein ASF55_17785 [Methylobacterium sp. Leaf119]
MRAVAASAGAVSMVVGSTAGSAERVLRAEASADEEPASTVPVAELGTAPWASERVSVSASPPVTSGMVMAATMLVVTRRQDTVATTRLTPPQRFRCLRQPVMRTTASSAFGPMTLDQARTWATKGFAIPAHERASWL